MSKTDSSLRLLAILRFSVPSNSSRTLNATQAYDVTSSGITLATAIGTLVDKDAAVKAGAPSGRDLSVGLTVMVGGETGNIGETDALGKKNVAKGYGVSTATVSMTQPPRKRSILGESTAGWGGTSTTGLGGLIDASNKPKATNPNTFFYGAITVGTGDYKKWQGNYAVLKINTVTGKGVLRIYDA